MAEVCNNHTGKKIVFDSTMWFVNDVDYWAFFDLSTATYAVKAAILLNLYEPEMYVATLVFEHALAHPGNDRADARIAVLLCYESLCYETRAVAEHVGVPIHLDTFAVRNIVPYVGARAQHEMAIRAILNSTLLRGQIFPMPAKRDPDDGMSAHPHGSISRPSVIFNLTGFIRQVSLGVDGVQVWGERSWSQTVSRTAFGATPEKLKRVAYLGIVNQDGAPIAVAGGVRKPRMTFNTSPGATGMYAIIYVQK